MVSALDSGSSGPDSSACCVPCMAGHLSYSHSASLSTQMLGSGNAAIYQDLIRRGVEILLISYIQIGISSGCMGTDVFLSVNANRNFVSSHQ